MLSFAYFKLIISIVFIFERLLKSNNEVGYGASDNLNERTYEM